VTVLRTLEHHSIPGKKITVERAEYRDFPETKWLFDTYSSGAYGLVPDSRIKKYIRQGAVHVVKVDGDIVAAAVGFPGKTLWNIMTIPEYRHLHLGTLLVQEISPDVIRVKCRPHEGMSDADLARFSDPTPFYQRLGFVEVGWDYPRGYFRGRDKTTGKGNFIRQGSIRRIKIMRRLKPEEVAPLPDRTAAPHIAAARDSSPGPRARAER